MRFKNEAGFDDLTCPLQIVACVNGHYDFTNMINI